MTKHKKKRSSWDKKLDVVIKMKIHQLPWKRFWKLRFWFRRNVEASTESLLNLRLKWIWKWRWRFKHCYPADCSHSSKTPQRLLGLNLKPHYQKDLPEGVREEDSRGVDSFVNLCNLVPCLVLWGSCTIRGLLVPCPVCPFVSAVLCYSEPVVTVISCRTFAITQVR